MKKCNFCYEEIQDSAIKCKHCGEFLHNKKIIGNYILVAFKYIVFVTCSIIGVFILDLIIILIIGTIISFENIWTILLITILAPISLGTIGFICALFSNIIKVGPNRVFSQKLFLIICFIYFSVKIIDSLLFYFLGGDTSLFSSKNLTLYTYALIISYVCTLSFLALAAENVDEKGMKRIFD